MTFNHILCNPEHNCTYAAEPTSWTDNKASPLWKVGALSAEL